MPDVWQLIAFFASPLFAAGGAYAAVRVELRWHLTEIKRAHARINQIERRI